MNQAFYHISGEAIFKLEIVKLFTNNAIKMP